MTTFVNNPRHVGHERTRRVKIGFGRVIFDFDVDNEVAARCQRHGQSGQVIRQISTCHLSNEATVRHGGVVVDHESPVGTTPHVELDAIGTHRHRFGEGGHGVFGNMLMKSTVGKDLSHPPTLPHRLENGSDFHDLSIVFADQGDLEKILIYPLKFEHPRRSLVIPLPEH